MMPRHCNVDGTRLIGACNKAWSAIFQQGKAVAIDEAIAPHKGKHTSGIIPYLPRKPHSTGINLYVMCDSVNGFVLECMYTRAETGYFDEGEPTRQVSFLPWKLSSILPTQDPNVVIVADTFCEARKRAGALASRQTAFLCLVKRDQLGIQEVGEGGCWRKGSPV